MRQADIDVPYPVSRDVIGVHIGEGSCHRTVGQRYGIGRAEVCIGDQI